MEFWEGALLVVGGIWLIGRVSRNSASHPLNGGAGGGGGPTPSAAAGQIQRSGGIVAGESIGTPAQALQGANIPVHVPPQATHPNALQNQTAFNRARGLPVTARPIA